MNQHKRLKRRMACRMAFYRLHEFRKLLIIFGRGTAVRMFKGRFFVPDSRMVAVAWDVENQRWIWPEEAR